MTIGNNTYTEMIDNETKISIIKKELIKEDDKNTDDAILFDSLPKDELELLSFKADIIDEIKAVEYNEIQEMGKLAKEDIIAAAVENISDIANSDISKFNIAKSFIENSMENNPNNANETKLGIIELINQKIENLS